MTKIYNIPALFFGNKILFSVKHLLKMPCRDLVALSKGTQVGVSREDYEANQKSAELLVLAIGRIEIWDGDGMYATLSRREDPQ